MTSTTEYPPTVILPNSSKPISLQDAQQQIADFLTRSQTNAYLHPDALIQPNGPTFSAQGGPQGGLVLQQLRRVEAGLRGEILKPDPKAMEKESDDKVLDDLIAGAEARMESQEATPLKRKGGLKRKAVHTETGDAEPIDGSQALLDGADGPVGAADPLDSGDEVNLAHGAETGELGDRMNLVQDGGEIPEVHAVPKSQAEKDAKKAAKKERKKAEKAARAAERLGLVSNDATAADPVDAQKEASPEKKRKKNEDSREEKKKKKRAKKGQHEDAS